MASCDSRSNSSYLAGMDSGQKRVGLLEAKRSLRSCCRGQLGGEGKGPRRQWHWQGRSQRGGDPDLGASCEKGRVKSRGPRRAQLPACRAKSLAS